MLVEAWGCVLESGWDSSQVGIQIDRAVQEGPVIKGELDRGVMFVTWVNEGAPKSVSFCSKSAISFCSGIMMVMTRKGSPHDAGRCRVAASCKSEKIFNLTRK